MNKNPFGSPEVLKHGNTYNADERLQEQYPYLICPECLGQNTHVVKMHRGFIHDAHTGDHTIMRKGIWVYDVTRVNYKCSDCTCEFYQWVPTNRHFLFSNIEIDDDIRNVLIWSLVLIIFIAMWVFSWSVMDDYGSPWWVVTLAVIGPVGTLITGFFGIEEGLS